MDKCTVGNTSASISLRCGTRVSSHGQKPPELDAAATKSVRLSINK